MLIFFYFLGVVSDRTHLVQRPIIATPDDKNRAFGGMTVVRRTEILGGKLPQCHFSHHKSHMT
jgi:hypothetical protein